MVRGKAPAIVRMLDGDFGTADSSDIKIHKKVCSHNVGRNSIRPNSLANISLSPLLWIVII